MRIFLGPSLLVMLTVSFLGNCKAGPKEECSTADHCDTVATCTRENEVDVCRCPAGYEDRVGNGSICQDIDECKHADTCPSIATCVNTPGKWACDCPDGYAYEGTECIDVNECDSGLHGCTTQQICRNSEGGFSCVCPEGFAGEACDACKRGYTRELVSGVLSCALVPINCRVDPMICSPGGLCIDVVGGDNMDFCKCDEGYEGHTCAVCALGYQDNDDNHTCEEGCGTFVAQCGANERCDDSSGTPECVCNRGWAGENCDQCAGGFEDVEGNDSCVAVTCAAAELDCGDHAQCRDDPYPPYCFCDLGYAGALCDDCSPTHMPDGHGNCIPQLDSSTMLLATARDPTRGPVLGAIDIDQAEFRPLVELAHELSALAYDSSNDTVYGLKNDSHQEFVFKVHVETGHLEELADLSSHHRVTALAFGGNQSHLHLRVATGANDSLLKLDPKTGISNLAGGIDVAFWDVVGWEYDLKNEVFVGIVTKSTSDRVAQAFELDPARTLSPTIRGILNINRPVLSVDFANHPSRTVPYVAGQMGGSDEEWLVEFCRQVSDGFGYDIRSLPASAIYRSKGWEGDSDIFSSNEKASLIAFGSYGRRSDPRKTIRLATSRENDVVCITTTEEPIDLVVDASAKFRLLIWTSRQAAGTLQIENGFVPNPTSGPPIRTYAWNEVPHESLRDPANHLKAYDNDAWRSLSLPHPRYESDLYQIAFFGTYHRDTNSLTYREITDVVLSGGLTDF